ncbi:LOW QUALITY PROTEIN: hypothetical protein V2J09_021866 [Rumex salicifolius]
MKHPAGAASPNAILVPAPSSTDRSAGNLPATRCHILFARVASPEIRDTTHQPPARRPPIGVTFTVQMTSLSEKGPNDEEILSVIDGLKKQVEADRTLYVQKVIEENKQKLLRVTLSKERRNDVVSDSEGAVDLLMKGQTDAINLQNGIDANNTDRSSSGSEDDDIGSSAILMGINIPVKSSVRPIKLPEVKRLPPYTTWIFLDRNQRMPEDQSVVGRRRIYYDSNGGEALICSDSEEERVEDDEEKKEYVQPEDQIIRTTIRQFGLSDDVLHVLGQYLCRKPSELKERYEILNKGEKIVRVKNGDVQGSPQANPYLDKDLDAALDSFDNLFCRRCYVFDCKLHGCSQDLVFPAEKQHLWNPPDDSNSPCGLHCYRSIKHLESTTIISSKKCDSSDENPNAMSDDAVAHTSPGKKGSSSRRKAKSLPSESASSNGRNKSESSDSDAKIGHDKNPIEQSSLPLKAKVAGKSCTQKIKKKRVSERVVNSMLKKQKKVVNSDCESLSADIHKGQANVEVNDLSAGTHDGPKKEEFVDESSGKQEAGYDKLWNPLEKSLYDKGLEIFGRNSCLIARNLLNGLKTCLEVYQYLTGIDNKLYPGGNAAGRMEGDEAMGKEGRRRSRFVRRKGRVRRLKYTWKSAAYHSIRKRISERKDQPCRQYNPCGCQSACGKQCACLLNGTCCEKYCGTAKTDLEVAIVQKVNAEAANVHALQQTENVIQMFAGIVGCGDGTLGVPSQRGDNYECRNMKLLLKQQQRVLLGRSDVSGWGAFLKNSVLKNEYLGEYTGELISHREADKRGKIYDRENSSLFLMLSGDKLKFANHSPEPNCYAKVIMVAGDHRVGIFAKERINAGEELFYDYRYEADRAPAWAKKPDAPGSKKDDAGPSSGRAKKLA